MEWHWVREAAKAKLKGDQCSMEIAGDLYRVVEVGEEKQIHVTQGRRSRSISSDKLGEVFTLRIHYANHDTALPSRNNQVVNSNHTGDNVIVALQQPQAEPRLLPGRLEGYEFCFCKKKKKVCAISNVASPEPQLVNLHTSSIWISLPMWGAALS